jgi:exonuclease VII small subunit
MPKQSQLDKAIEKLEQEIQVLQMAKRRLEDQRQPVRKATTRTKSAGSPSEA